MLAVVACGNKETGKQSDGKKTEETVQSEIEDDKADVEVGEDTNKEEETTEDNTQVESPDNAQSDSAQPTEPVVTKTAMYAKSNVNVRSGAGTSNAQIGSLTKGQEVVKIGEENGWSKIEFNGGIGYVSSKYLSAEKVSASTANSSVGNGNVSTNNNANIGNTTPSTSTHEHTWVTEDKTYEYIKTYVNGCNGCGYPLFTITESGTQPIENSYSHPACYSEKLGMDCTGGGFHNESYTRGYCYFCGGKVEFRQCMWTEMGKLCSKNEALGAYEKIVFDQNHFMYLNSCVCGKNWIVIRSGDGKGLILVKEYCSICGAIKE